MCAGGVDMCHLSLSTAEAQNGGGATHNEDHSVGFRGIWPIGIWGGGGGARGFQDWGSESVTSTL